MLIACPNCGNPVCSDCGTHVSLSPGSVGTPTLTRAVLFSQIQKPVGVKPVIVTWKSSMAPTWNGTYEAYWLQRIDGYHRWQAASQPEEQIFRSVLDLPNYWALLGDWLHGSFATPATFLARYRPFAIDPTPVPGVWYAEAWHPWVAAQASRSFLDSLGMMQAGTSFAS